MVKLVVEWKKLKLFKFIKDRIWNKIKFIKDHIWNKINSWSSRCLSQASREVLIKSVLQSIPSYLMSTFLLPNSLIKEIEKMFNAFWWGHGNDNRRGMHWMAYGPKKLWRNGI